MGAALHRALADGAGADGEDGSIVPRTLGTPQGGVGAGHTRVTENEFAAL